MKSILLLAKPLSAVAALSVVTFHAVWERPVQPSTAPHQALPASGLLLPPDPYGPEWFTSPALGGRGDLSSGSVFGYADPLAWQWPLPHERMDLRWGRLRLRELPDDLMNWRPWQLLRLDAEDAPCEELNVKPPPAPDPAVERTADVLAYQAACLTLPPRAEAITYGLRARANGPGTCGGPEEIRPWIHPMWQEGTHNWDSLRLAHHGMLMEQLARALDSLIATMRKDTTVVMP